MKWTKAPNITPKNKSSRTIHTRTKVESEGIVTIKATIVPFNAISRIESLDDSLPVNSKILKNGNKNQRSVRKYRPNFFLDFIGELFSSLIKLLGFRLNFQIILFGNYFKY